MFTLVVFLLSHVYSGGLPAGVLPSQHAGFCVFGGEGYCRAGALQVDAVNMKKFEFVHICFAGFLLWVTRSHVTVPCVVLHGAVGDPGAAEQLCLAGL